MTIPIDFNWEVYLKLNPDVAKVNPSKAFAELHWKTYGKRENRKYKETVNKMEDTHIQVPIIPGIVYEGSEFDWKYYVEYNKDLRLAGINDKDRCMRHFITYGYKENRTYRFKPVNDKFYLIDLNPNLGAGLFNQIWALMNAILIGTYTSRNIIIKGFYPDYNKSNTIPLSYVINLHSLRKTLLQTNIKIGIYESGEIDTKNWIKSTCYNPTRIPSILNGDIHGYYQMIQLLRSETNNYIELGNVYHYRYDEISLYPTDTHKNFVKYMFRQLEFAPAILTIVDYCKQTLGLNTGYNAVHLRLEDDMLYAFAKCINKTPQECTREIMNRYYNSMQKIFNTHEEIYISTHLLKSQNLNNPIVYEIKTHYPNIKFWNTGESWRTKFPNIPLGREIDAMIDFLICVHAHKFVGYVGSSFSRLVDDMYKYEGKTSILI